MSRKSFGRAAFAARTAADMAGRLQHPRPQTWPVTRTQNISKGPPRHKVCGWILSSGDSTLGIASGMIANRKYSLFESFEENAARE